ncbi:MAG: hypothetical protein ABWW65_06640 [Thermoprotei archaeon]
MKCNNIAVLHENGAVNYALARCAKCYLAGLHTDPPTEVIKKICSTYKCSYVRLSNIPYIASALIPILEFIIDSNTF